ncbi:lipopolysaccharide biosynthesis protein [Amaricoccus solimangrovi]|uniref:Lipopolysaccharide biosynthesis protein n=1 Tax=Amaricoccus solimangrovi TaxID=2589815 RepID=A0A501WH07_9RHOB|nr:lipopolysaccharide biosynthesis protein [Amaricoccus solimangrovi]
MAWTSLAMGSQAVLQLAALVILSRLLPPAQFGLFSAAMVVAGLCAIFYELGVGPAIVQRPELEPRHIRAGFTLSVALSLAVGLLVWLGAPAIASLFRIPDLEPVARIMALAFPLQGISTVAQSLAQRNLRFGWLALVDTAAFAAGYLLVAPALTLLHAGVWALVGAYLAQQTLRAILLLIGQPHAKRPLLEAAATRELLYFGAGFTLARIGNYIAGQGDNLVVGRWLGQQALGFYAHAYQLMATPALMLGQVLDRVLFPAMALVQAEPARLIRAYRGGVFTCALVILPTSMVIFILADEIVLLLLGPAWAGVADPLRILAWAMLFRASYKMSDTIARATGAVYARAWRQALFAAAVIGFSVIGQAWGLGGVACGVFAALAVNFLTMASLSLRLTGMGWADFARAHLPGIVLAILVGVTGALAADWLRAAQAGALLTVAGTAGLGGITGAAALFLRPGFFMGPDGERLLRAVSNVIRPKQLGEVGE